MLNINLMLFDELVENLVNGLLKLPFVSSSLDCFFLFLDFDLANAKFLNLFSLLLSV